MPGRRKTRRVKRGGDIPEITTVLDEDQQENIETYIGVDVDELVDAMNTLLNPAGENTSAARSIVADARVALDEADDELYLEHIDALREIFHEFDEKMGNVSGGRRRRRGGIPADIRRAQEAAYEKGVQDAKRQTLKQYSRPPPPIITLAVRGLVVQHPSVEKSILREYYAKGFLETRVPNPVANTGGRRKTLRGGTSKQMVDALREAENMGRIHKTVGDPSRADSVADSLMRRFHLVDVEPSFHPRTLLRDKYIATYNQTSRATTQGSFLEALQGRIANLLS
jgi:hypothetical protein